MMDASGFTLDRRSLSARGWLTEPAFQADRAARGCPRQDRRGIFFAVRQNLAVGTTVLRCALSTQYDAQNDLAVIKKVEAQVNHAVRLDACWRQTRIRNRIQDMFAAQRALLRPVSITDHFTH
jgi:hypothetical protein